MTSLELLLQRQSNPLLCDPAPQKSELDKILSAGMRVPDHACLQPWHFTVISGDGLQRLSDLFVSTLNEAVEQVQLMKTKKMPFRAPLMIVVSTKYHAHEKVPKQEQLIAAGCCAHAMQMAAFALGYGAMWRTGNFAYDQAIKEGLSINTTDDIVGFLYIGTKVKELPIKSAKPFESKVSYWL
ncbi:MAG: NAD(P)H nitroreductase [Colwellia sp.]